MTDLLVRSGAVQPLQLISAHPTAMYCTAFRVQEPFTNCTAMFMSVPEELMRHIVRIYGKEGFFAVRDDRDEDVKLSFHFSSPLGTMQIL